MKRRLFAVCAIMSTLRLMGGESDFDAIDSAATSAVKLRVEAQEQAREWASAKRSLAAELDALKSANLDLKARIKVAEEKESLKRENLGELSKKLNSDASKHSELSAYLDSRYAQIWGNPESDKILSSRGYSANADFSTMGLAEKFRLLCDILKILKAEDSKVEISDVVSTGVFVRASGKSRGDEAMLKIDSESSGKGGVK